MNIINTVNTVLKYLNLNFFEILEMINAALELKSFLLDKWNLTFFTGASFSILGWNTSSVLLFTNMEHVRMVFKDASLMLGVLFIVVSIIAKLYDTYLKYQKAKRERKKELKEHLITPNGDADKTI